MNQRIEEKLRNSQATTNPRFIKKACFLDGKDELDEQDLEIIIEELDKIESKKEEKELFSQ